MSRAASSATTRARDGRAPLARAHWLARDLVNGPYLCLALSEEAFNKAFNHLQQPWLDRPRWVLNDHSNATAHTLVDKHGRLCAVVCLRDFEGHSGIEIAGLLVHEAVHLWQRFREHIGEHSPSAEFEAYSIQSLAQRLMWSFEEQTR